MSENELKVKELRRK